MTAPASASEAPSLIVILIVDGLSYQQMVRELPSMRGAFKRFEREGAWYTKARFDHGVTMTAPGHATLLTGAHPRKHGVVSNRWVSPQRDRTLDSVKDPQVEPLKASREPYGVSPRRLESSTLGDTLKECYGEASRVLSIGGKDRSAVLAGGHRGQVYYLGGRTRRFVTSTYYRTDYPAWWKEYYRRVSQESLLRAGWTEDRMTLDMAQAAARGEGMGAVDGAPDLLIVCLSGLDRINHVHGPSSKQSLYHLRELDALLADWMTGIEALTGPGHVIFALTSDHGFPGLSKPAGKKRSSKVVHRDDLLEALGEEFGETGLFKFEGSWLWVSRKGIEASGSDPLELRARAKELLRKYPGVRFVIEEEEARQGETGFERAAWLSWHPANAGDLYLVPEEGRFFSEYRTGFMHGSSYEYDTHVPLVFLGAPFRPGKLGPASAVDLAPTLASLAGIGLPQADGEVLQEVFAERAVSRGK